MFTFKFFVFCLVIGSVQLGSASRYSQDHRSKRQVNSIPLVYPYGATYKLLIGFSSPVQNLDSISLAFAANFQYQYLQFQNISELSRYYLIKDVSREERDLRHRRNERLVFYRSLETLLDSQGMNGPECVLRAICEAAQYPVMDQGLFGEIIHILLTWSDDIRRLLETTGCSEPKIGPSGVPGGTAYVQQPDYGRTAFDDDATDSIESQYVDAATVGRQMFHCPSMYSGCPEGQGLMEMLSVLRDD